MFPKALSSVFAIEFDQICEFSWYQHLFSRVTHSTWPGIDAGGELGRAAISEGAYPLTREIVKGDFGPAWPARRTLASVKLPAESVI